mgnify:CR=1 FL=1
MKKVFEKFKAKWNIQSDRDFWMIMLTFSLAGMLIGFERRPIFHLLGIEHETPFWIKTLVYIPLIPPIYQLNLMFFGTILGQFAFFWEKEKKLGRFLRKKLTGR